MTVKPQNLSCVYIPASCTICDYPTVLDAYTPGEAFRCPECGHELVPIRMQPSEYNRWTQVVPAIGLFCCGQVCISVAAVSAWVFALLFEMPDTILVIVAGTLLGCALFMLIPVAVALSKHTSSWLSTLMILAWLFNACAWLVWVDQALIFHTGRPKLVILSLTVFGLGVIQVVPWKMSKWHPHSATAISVRKLSLYAIGYVLLCPAAYIALWNMLTVDQQEYWLVPFGYPACLGALVLVVAPATSLLLRSSKWEQLIEVQLVRR